MEEAESGLILAVETLFQPSFCLLVLFICDSSPILVSECSSSRFFQFSLLSDFISSFCHLSEYEDTIVRETT